MSRRASAAPPLFTMDCDCGHRSEHHDQLEGCHNYRSIDGLVRRCTCTGFYSSCEQS